MDLIYFLIDFILHIDVHLAELVAEYGVWVYAILFLILFCETGLVVTPFLPGDSLAVCGGDRGRSRASQLPGVYACPVGGGDFGGCRKL
mgnify:CR=1 FL=1